MKNFLITAFTLICLDVSAFTVNRMIWQISDCVTNAYLYDQLSSAERHAKFNELNEAAEILEALQNEKVASEYLLPNGEPLDLVLSSAILWYKAEQIKNVDPEIAENARKLIGKWAEKAKGRQWQSYKFLFHRIRSYYIAIKNPKGRIETQKEMILYDPFDEEQIKSLDEYCVRFPESIGDLKTFLEQFKKAGGILSPRLELTLITLSDKSSEEKLDNVITWLGLRKNAELEIIQLGVEYAIGLISVENSSGVKKLYDSLSDLALWQPANEERMPIVALLLNERAKIKAIAPDAIR